MFILDVSVGVSVHFITSAIGFCFGYYSLDVTFMSFTFVVVELELGGGASAAVGAPQLHLICGSVSGRRDGAADSPAGVRCMPTGLSSF